MGFLDWLNNLMFKELDYINGHYEKADVSVECEDSADNGVINIDNSYVIIYNF